MTVTRLRLIRDGDGGAAQSSKTCQVSYAFTKDAIYTQFTEPSTHPTGKRNPEEEWRKELGRQPGTAAGTRATQGVVKVFLELSNKNSASSGGFQSHDPTVTKVYRKL